MLTAPLAISASPRFYNPTTFINLESPLILRMLLSFNHVIDVAFPDATTQFRVTRVPIVGL
jgi:hypothetical protein